MNLQKTSCMFVVMLLLFTGLAWGEQVMLTPFISGNPQFEPDKDTPGAMIYQNPKANLASYQKILIDPIEIWIAPDSEYKGLDPDESKMITDSLRQALVKELTPKYAVVNEPGPGVLGVRLAITNIHIRHKKRGLLGYTPIGLVLTTAANLADLRTELDRAAIEVELLDGGTNERLGALVDPFHTGEKGEKLSWDEVNKRLNFYAKRFRGRLDKAHSGAGQ